ncbi:hypothetical protein BS47DRAFT_1341678 [Hydnum rufescens UP504]|uniref:Rheb n=1 Tax=Hydnum rufescens UP504 TaxID=1448309 RepID=A0A9P6B2G6_9AGAM|nr:hypothetical protein BS47DRAFT_1341678 [Hydnum rufescens UP504]
MASNDSLFRRRKIAVLGSRSVGKSSLVTQFIENKFVPQYYPTIENTFTKAIKHNGQEYECDIIDTAGQDEYSPLSSRHAIGIHGYVLVYSVASRNSFHMVRIIHDKIVNQSGMASIPCVVVGQKNDLVEDSSDNRQVPAAEGKKLADALGSAWVETSARQNTNIAKVFDLALGEIEKTVPTGSTEARKGGCVVM